MDLQLKAGELLNATHTTNATHSRKDNNQESQAIQIVLKMLISAANIGNDGCNGGGNDDKESSRSILEYCILSHQIFQFQSAFCSFQSSLVCFLRHHNLRNTLPFLFAYKGCKGY
ncbi:hypothetical protein [Helicobacter rodentium]|uniref:hypothetical protein n=1 Tax=Helicobacter rodentium TaxID=59617 RepID=UPI0025583119|nr:hypothetical protein [Helicobacter rodentium]